MHSDFANWYSTAVPRFDAARLESRWQAVETTAASASGNDPLDLARLFYSRPVSDAFRERIRQAIRDFDVAYVTIKDDSELAILSGASLVALLGRGGAEASKAALAVLTLDLRGQRSGQRLTDILDRCNEYLADEAVRLREVFSEAPQLESESLSEAIESFKTKASTGDANTAIPYLPPIFDQLLQSFRRITETATPAARLQTAYAEQSDILWWLFGERTSDLRRRFADMQTGEASLAAGFDLAELTKLIPGPQRAPAFLEKMLRSGARELAANTSVSKAVDGCTLKEKERWASQLRADSFADIWPTLYAIRKSVEAGGTGEWVAAYKTGTGLDPDAALQPVELALQVYNEVLLSRCMGQ